MSNEAVAITGVGVLSAAGSGLAALAAALRADRCCGRDSGSPMPVAQVAAIPLEIEPDPDFPDDRKGWLARLALRQALADAGLPLRPGGSAGRLDGADFGRPSPRRALFLGTGLSSVTPRELEEDIYPHLQDGGFDRARMARDLDPGRGAPRRHLPGRVTAMLAADAGVTGPTGTSFSACAAAAQAIAAGLRALRRGEADIAIVGGHDSMIHPVGMLSFVVLGALAPQACRPFDREREGFLLGEGAGILVLERLDHARARGARVRALLAGAGTSVNAWNVTAPHPEGEGAERAMRRALADAGLPSGAVGYVNAHGTGTPVGDAAESRAISRVFGESGDVLVSSVKGAIGHTIAACGAVEAAACVAALEGGWLPGTVGLRQVDPGCPVQVLPRAADVPVDAILSNSFGFGGQNCSLLLRRAG